MRVIDVCQNSQHAICHVNMLMYITKEVVHNFVVQHAKIVVAYGVKQGTNQPKTRYNANTYM